ncbi:hypothetical protein ABW21_db0207557 [Orbilia brochopaga]|nr:hypothetical protein ABW21_db0207557 [Drechslerella brochopaga]
MRYHYHFDDDYQATRGTITSHTISARHQLGDRRDGPRGPRFRTDPPVGCPGQYDLHLYTAHILPSATTTDATASVVDPATSSIAPYALAATSSGPPVATVTTSAGAAATTAAPQPAAPQPAAPPPPQQYYPPPPRAAPGMPTPCRDPNCALAASFNTRQGEGSHWSRYHHGANVRASHPCPLCLGRSFRNLELHNVLKHRG